MGFFQKGRRSDSPAERTGNHVLLTNPWHAVEVRVSPKACPACRALAGKRFLSIDAPALPVKGCTQPPTCRAVYKHHDDRRGGGRREGELPFGGMAKGPPGGKERRTGRGRRSTDGGA
jgi:hypothetical protein